MSDPHAHDHPGGADLAAGHADEHGHDVAGEPLGPIDRRAWGAALAGTAVAALVLLALYLAIGS